MPVLKEKKSAWENQVKINSDPYGGACVNVARRVMEILDEEQGDFDCHKIVCQADKDTKAGGITGFMAGCVASMVSEYHSRGKEFRVKWNAGYDVDEKKAKGGVVNPAIMTIASKK